MRSILVYALLLFALMLGAPPFAKAQYDFESGSFLLKSSANVRRTGLLRTGSSNLVVKQTNNEPTVKYPWEEVLSYRLGLSRYVRMSGFAVRKQSGWGEEIADNVFVQLLDSGTVSLMRCDYQVPSGMGGQGTVTVFLLKRPGDAGATAIPYSILANGGGKEFREAVAPFVAERPDLVAVLNSKKVTVGSLQTFIHAFNTHEPFLNYPMVGALPGSNAAPGKN